MTDAKPLVLLVEDDEHDVIATRRAWRREHIPNPLRVVGDGESCLDYLYRRPPFDAASAPRPGIVLLDLHLPRMDGLEVLRVLRSDPDFRFLPVIMLTSSRTEQDRLRSYAGGASAFITKPIGFDNFAAAVRTISEFWNLAQPVEDPR
ncbi:MAG: response regulator [Rhodocyclaceae bacterium]|jgi:CheY-like chemotaxis protein|nr:response regulator [Rhodocyclaceae bacterium]